MFLPDMIRKLVRHGPSTLIVSLPAEWVKRKGLKEKDEVDIVEEENFLKVCVKRVKKKDSILVDVSHLDRTSLILLLQAIYKSGFAKATLHFDQQETIHFRTGEKVLYSRVIHQLMNRFIGFEISRESENDIEITQVSYIDREEISTMVNRTFLLLKDIVDFFCEAMKKGDRVALERIEDKHESITKLLVFILRAISRGEYGHKETVQGIAQILTNIDRIMDILKYIARTQALSKRELNRKLHPLLDLFRDSISDYNVLFRRYDDTLIYKISKCRDDFKHRSSELKSTLHPEEVVVITSMTQAMEHLFGMLEWRMYMQIAEKAE